MEISCNYTLNTPVLTDPLQFTVPVGLIDSCPQDMCWGLCGRNKLQTQPTSRSQLPQVNFLKSFMDRKKGGKNTSHRTGCSASLIFKGGMTIRMTTGNQIPPFRMDILTGPPTVNMGESQEMLESHDTLVGNGHCQQPLEKTASPMPEEKEPFKRAKPGINIPTPGPTA